MHVAEALDAVGFAEAVADLVVDGPGFFVALAGERVLGQLQVHVAEASDAVGFAEAVADLVVDGPGFFVALAGERVLGTVVEPICAAKQDVALCLRFQRFPCQVMAFSQGQKLGYPRAFPRSCASSQASHQAFRAGSSSVQKLWYSASR